jgi:hypothetical protein
LDLVKVWHPDRYQAESPRLREKAEAKLKSINAAYDRLQGVTSEPAKETARSRGPESGKPGPVDLFASDFGRGWGFVNRDGKLVIPANFDVAEQFAEGLAHVAECGRHGFINWQGQYIINPNYSNARSFSEGLAAVVFSTKWGYIDHMDRYVINPLYDDCGDFSEGLAAVLWRGRWGYLDKTGRFAVNPRFDEARKFLRGRAEVRFGSRWGEVSPSGEVFFDDRPAELSGASS